ncbi:hypothetical protein Cantr_04579 [Candida viswanathii]|uniref:TUG ubiquitin-like domain-containing protein n=1 Tax=Candida viswanathii TaxID=5486 RepID=A0A367XLE3_9ASCO|nr:hypothetical protein Cantr_04579 [Candida viswanathii]
MSTINFNITYGRQLPKKVTIAKASTINQLATEALAVFKIDPDSYSGKLYHNDKLLDGTLPIRLTNLLNNSKLVLKVVQRSSTSSPNRGINVKFMSDLGSSVKKVSNGLKLIDVVKEFGGDVSKPSTLRILELNIESEKYDKISLDTIVGDSNNVVIRLNYRKNDSAEVERKQQEAIRAHLELERSRIQKEEQARLAELEKQARLKESEQREVGETNDAKSDKDVEMKEPEEQREEQPKPPVKEEIAQDSNHYTFKEEELNDTPQLYVPSKTPLKSYNNPDEDYEVTLNQVKAYQNMIRNSGRRKSPKDKTVQALPKKYQIRVKFPDGTILQINFIENVEQVKFGNLIKKIDELLLPQFINGYNLKNSVPPFTTIDMNFTTNNEYLHKLPDFQEERIMLIWELQKKDLNVHGPYVKNSQLSIKQSDQLPERVLESHRGELPDDEHHTKPQKKSEEGQSDGDGKSSKKPKVPKWFKMK